MRSVTSSDEKCNEFAEPIAVTSAKVHSARLLGDESMASCVNLIDSGIKPTAPRQKTEVSSISRLSSVLIHRLKKSKTHRH